MRTILADALATYRTRSYAELRSLVEAGFQDTFEVTGPSGSEYQVEIQFFWDDRPLGDIRVFGSIDGDEQRPLLGFIPIYFTCVTDSFILSPSGHFVDE